jgi:hypothetical protein
MNTAKSTADRLYETLLDETVRELVAWLVVNRLRPKPEHISRLREQIDQAMMKARTIAELSTTNLHDVEDLIDTIPGYKKPPAGV